MSLQLLLVCFLASQALPQTTAHRCYEFKSLITRPLEGQQEDKSYTDALRRRTEFRELLGREEEGSITELALSMKELHTFVTKKQIELLFGYDAIPFVNGQYSRHEASKNHVSSRYPYAHPYDFNRVVLNNWFVGSYVSASSMSVEIPGPKPFTLNYIAAECPLHESDVRETRPEFWTMVLNSESTLMVMMDSPDEIECQGLLPQSEKKPWQSKNGHITVELLNTQQKATFHLHEITITGWAAGSNTRKTVKVNYVQRRFREVFNTFLHEVRKLRNEMTQEDSRTPLIVLCKDGVGWTGMFILADVALYRIDVDQAVYPLALIKELRDLRPSFIPKFEQFKWISKFILDYYNRKHPGLLDPLN